MAYTQYRKLNNYLNVLIITWFNDILIFKIFYIFVYQFH